MAKKLILIVVGLAIAVGGVLLFITLKSEPPKPVAKAEIKSYKDSATGTSFNYAGELEQLPLTEADKKDKFVFRAQKTQGDESLFVSVRYQEGIKGMALLLKKQPLQLLIDDARKSFPLRYPGYKELTSRNLSVNGKEASILEFTYNNAQGQTVRQKFMVIMKDDNTAYYVSAQALDQNFSSVSKQYFEPIFSSIKFQ